MLRFSFLIASWLFQETGEEEGRCFSTKGRSFLSTHGGLVHHNFYKIDKAGDEKNTHRML